MIDTKNLLATFACILGFLIIVAIAGLFCECLKGCGKQLPRKGSVNIDSLTTVNDSIKLEVKSLDSIKNAKVIEVISLDNDSTIKLFYKLVSE